MMFMFECDQRGDSNNCPAFLLPHRKVFDGYVQLEPGRRAASEVRHPVVKYHGQARRVLLGMGIPPLIWNPYNGAL